MPRYNGNKRTPRSKQRQFMLRKRKETDRTEKDNPEDYHFYEGYAHGIDGTSNPGNGRTRLTDIY